MSSRSGRFTALDESLSFVSVFDYSLNQPGVRAGLAALHPVSIRRAPVLRCSLPIVLR